MYTITIARTGFVNLPAFSPAQADELLRAAHEMAGLPSSEPIRIGNPVEWNPGRS